MEVIVRTNLPAHKVLALMSRLPQTATRRRLPPCDQLLVRVGVAILYHIHKAFVVKAAGGTDEGGLYWPKLSPKTIAYKRRHPLQTAKGPSKKKTLPGQSTRAGYRPSYQLTKTQRAKWWEVYASGLRRYKGDKAHAAAVAWIVLRNMGAQTLLQVYGGLPVEILRDTGLLLNSLMPGTATPGTATPGPNTPAPNNPKQIFRLRAGEVILGTSREGASAHHEGRGRNPPQRRLWPAPAQWPANWWADVLEQAQEGMIDIALALLGNP